MNPMSCHGAWRLAGLFVALLVALSALLKVLDHRSCSNSMSPQFVASLQRTVAVPDCIVLDPSIKKWAPMVARYAADSLFIALAQSGHFTPIPPTVLSERGELSTTVPAENYRSQAVRTRTRHRICDGR